MSKWKLALSLAAGAAAGFALAKWEQQKTQKLLLGLVQEPPSLPLGQPQHQWSFGHAGHLVGQDPTPAEPEANPAEPPAKD